jgi:predicted Zn-ribbon and HTH transcriptional regulator
MIIVGIYSLVTGIKKISQTIKSKGKTMTCCYKCGKCGNEWKEENIIAQ